MKKTYKRKSKAAEDGAFAKKRTSQWTGKKLENFIQQKVAWELYVAELSGGLGQVDDEAAEDLAARAVSRAKIFVSALSAAKLLAGDEPAA